VRRDFAREQTVFATKTGETAARRARWSGPVRGAVARALLELVDDPRKRLAMNQLIKRLGSGSRRKAKGLE
jgi:hypothetical protein